MNLTKLILKQDSNDVEEFLTGSIISTLFNFDNENINILLKGYIRCNRGYELDSNYLNTKYVNFHSSVLAAYYKFEDSTFELFLISRGIGDGTGIAIEDMNNYNGSWYSLFYVSEQNYVKYLFTKMNEMKYFINLNSWYNSALNGAQGRWIFKNLQEITFPYNIIPVFHENPFYYNLLGYNKQQSPRIDLNCKIRIDYKEGYLLRGNYLFYSNNKIQESAYFPKGITESGSFDASMGYNYNDLGTVERLPDKKVYGDTFINSGILNIIYPDYITKVYDAFIDCTNLQYVIYNENITTVNMLSIFRNVTLDVDLIFKSINVPTIIMCHSINSRYDRCYKELPYDYSTVQRMFCTRYNYNEQIGQNNVYVYVPDAVYNDYNQNMIPFKYFYDGTTGTKFDSNKWHLRRMGDYRSKMLGYGLTDEDINRQPTIIL